jgi:hypothetical protein
MKKLQIIEIQLSLTQMTRQPLLLVLDNYNWKGQGMRERMTLRAGNLMTMGARIPSIIL